MLFFSVQEFFKIVSKVTDVGRCGPRSRNYSKLAVGATTLVSHSEAHTIQESFLRFEAKNFSGYYMYLGN